MPTYIAIVDEVLTQTATYIVTAKSKKEAEEKALAGDTESQDIDPYDTEIASRSIRSIELES
jgi:hypothetical protein